MMRNQIKISISEQYEKFKQHIQDETTNRILFSGPFGSGKTYFLREFFKKEEDYSPFFIYPVNYSVSHNEDIFELLKFDIFFVLLRLEVNFEEEDTELERILRQYNLLEKSSDLILDILRNSGKIGKNVVSIAEKLVKVEEIIGKKKTNKQTDRERIIQFLKISSKKTGSINEEDNSTLLIKHLLDKVKATGKKPVLIIDDLDRIDPDHIFRLFNVFAAHLDRNENDNKFGFDKIIFVCDFNNIRNLFEAKYGSLVDFSGYMAKFYSADVYKFENKKSVEERIKEILLSANIEDEFLDDFPIRQPSSILHTEILYILTCLFRCGAVSLRNLVKVESYQYPFQKYSLLPFTGLELCSNNLDLLQILDFISWVVGRGDALLLAIEKAAKSLVHHSTQDHSDLFGYDKLAKCIAILTLRDSYDARSHPSNETYHFNEFGMQVSYKVQAAGQKRESFIIEITETKHQERTSYFEVLLQVIERLQSYQLLK